MMRLREPRIMAFRHISHFRYFMQKRPAPLRNCGWVFDNVDKFQSHLQLLYHRDLSSSSNLQSDPGKGEVSKPKSTVDSGSPTATENSGADNQSYSDHITKSYIARKIKEIESSMFESYLKGYNKRQTMIILLLLATAVIGSSLIYIFREPIKENISDEVADVASRSLG